MNKNPVAGIRRVNHRCECGQLRRVTGFFLTGLLFCLYHAICVQHGQSAWLNMMSHKTTCFFRGIFPRNLSSRRDHLGDDGPDSEALCAYESGLGGQVSLSGCG